MSDKLIKKYKYKTYCKKLIGCNFRRKAKETGLERKTTKSVRQFFLKDDVSRLTTGKRETVTLRKVKIQRRLLSDSLLNLHKKYLSEHQQISYAFFCHQRPFWVVPPKERDRETCQCKTHENLQFMVDKLHKLGISNCQNLEEMFDSTVCSTSKTGLHDVCLPSEQVGW